MTANSFHESADTDIKSIAPIGLNAGLYLTGLMPYLKSETAAVTALQAAASSALPQLAILDALSGSAGTIIALCQAIISFCTAMQTADADAHASIAKVVK